MKRKCSESGTNIWNFLCWKLNGESPLFSQICAKNRLEICGNLSNKNIRIIMCKTIASPMLHYVTSRALLLIYETRHFENLLELHISTAKTERDR